MVTIEEIINYTKDNYGIIIICSIFVLFLIIKIYNKYKSNEDDFSKYPETKESLFFKKKPLCSETLIINSSLSCDAENEINKIKKQLKALEDYKTQLIAYEYKHNEKHIRQLQEIEAIKEKTNKNYEYLMTQFELLTEIKQLDKRRVQ